MASETEQLGWERRARTLLQRVAVATAEPIAPEAALQLVIDEVCRCTGWPVGHALVLDASGAAVSSRLWHLDDPLAAADFRAASEASRFPPGVGMPGRVLESGRPLWIMDVARDPNFPRAAVAGAHGLHAGFSFPVRVGGRVRALLEFFAHVAVEPDAPLLEVMESIGAQLGRVYERRRAEEALRESEARMSAVARSANDAIITADARGDVVSWNRAAEAMFGWTEEEMRGQPLGRIIPERFRAPHQRGLERVGGGGPRHVIGRTVELSGLRKDGSELPIELSLSHWSQGGAAFFTGILRDISERKAAAARLEVVAAQLAASERRAVDANRAKSVFLANMSHELRTPLNAILGFVQLLARDAGLSEGQRENLEVILRSGEHLLSLINDVLSLSKIEAGGIERRENGFDPQRLLAAAVDMFRLRARSRGLLLELAVAPAFPRRVRGDEGKLRQVLINLLGNAVKFTAAGSVRLEAGWEGGAATFAVQDTGPGVAPEDRARIFEPFAQGGSDSAREGGTGLGLAISREFVRVMGGDLMLESARGRGARFSFRVPLPEEAQGSEAAPPEGRVVGLAPGTGEVRVLAVDNLPEGRLLLVRLLGAIGCTVREAADGQEAVAVWKEFHPQLVWMDMRMPVLDGFAATRAIRAAEREQGLQHTCVVALTASAFDDDRPAIAAAGCDDVLHKPFDEAHLFAVMEQRLGVRFVREAPAAPAPSEPAGGGLEALSPAEVAPLRAALERGDDLAALAEADRLAARAPALAQSVRAMVKAFQFDELLRLIERQAGEAA